MTNSSTTSPAPERDSTPQQPHSSAPSPGETSATGPNVDKVAPQAESSEASTLAKFQADLADLQAKSAELSDLYLRAKAEAENARRRAEEDVAKTRKFALESFADSLLPVIDSLEAGLAVKEASVDAIREGTQATLRQLLTALERNKVIAIDPAVGDKFDPHHHQAISVVPSEQDANTIVTVLQKGYLIAERVLRPALVIVAAAK